MEELFILILSIAAAIFASCLGWAESEEPFIPRKLLSTLIRAGVGGISVAYFFIQAHPSPMAIIDWFMLFMTAMGIDYTVNNTYKIITKKPEE